MENIRLIPKSLYYPMQDRPEYAVFPRWVQKFKINLELLLNDMSGVLKH